MKVVYAIIVIIMILGIIGTLFEAGNVGTDCDKLTKCNIKNLIIIYVVLFLGLTAGLW